MSKEVKKEDLKIEYVDINSIKPFKRNAKLHPSEQIKQIKKSITDYKMCDPIGIWHDEIVEGHGRYIACKELGFDKVPVIRLDYLTDEQRREYALVHNKTTMNSGFDFSILDSELSELANFDAEFFDFDISKEPDIPDIKVKELAPYNKVHYLITLDINDNDKVIDMIAKIRSMEGIEVESTLN